MEIVFQTEKECYVCGTTLNLHKHHIFGGSNRKWSEKYNLYVRLCACHHNMSDEGVHFNKPLDLRLKREAQALFETINGHEEFMRIFGKNYL